MNSTPLLPPELLVASRNRWDLAVECLLAALLAFMPLAFGAVEAWSELIVIGLAAALSLVVALRVAADRIFYLPWTWAYAPLALFVLLAALQLTPMPTAWLAALSPDSAALREELLGPAGATAADSTISMYPPATSRGLRLLLVGAAVFFAVVATYRTAPKIKRLLLIVFTIGCAEAALALLQIATRADKLYWAFDAGTSRLTSGSFINYSNFSQFMNLSIGAGAALLLVRLDEERRRGGRRDDTSRPFGGARLSRHGGLLAGLALSSAAVVASLSRAGVASLVAAAAVVAAALLARGALNRRAWVLAVVPLAVLAGVLAFGFDAIYDRLATLAQRDQLASRWELTLGALRAWREFPVWGAGLGTHQVVFPMFDASTSPQLAEHADNDYAQLLEETGVVGAALVAAFVAAIGARLVRLARRGQTPLSAAAFGLAFGLLAAAIHSGSDFGQRLPAVFCLSAVACGLAVQLDRIERSAGDPSLDRRRIAVRRGRAVAAVIGLIAAWSWAFRGAYSAHVGEQWWAAALQLDDNIRQRGPDARDEDYADLLASMEQAVRSEPHNVHYGYWLNAYRWQALSRLVDAGSGRGQLSAEARPLVAQIADELAAVSRLGPTYGPTYALEGQLRLLILSDQRGADLIAQGMRLAPYDAPTCLAAAEAAARDGRGDDAAALLRRTVALAPGLFRDAVEVALLTMNRPDVAQELAGDDFVRLEQLAAVAATSDQHAELADGFRAAAEAALRLRVARGDARTTDLAALAAIEAKRGAHDAAIDLYFLALKADYSQVNWRLARARALAVVGRNAEALQEARRCLRQRPGHAAAAALVEQLQRRSE